MWYELTENQVSNMITNQFLDINVIMLHTLKNKTIKGDMDMYFVIIKGKF